MYFDTYVDVPNVPGKITVKMKKYVMFEIGRIYLPEKKYNRPERVCIGILKEDDDTKMKPNETFRIHFPDVQLDEVRDSKRSSCLRIGDYLIIDKIVREYQLDELLKANFDEDTGLLLDLVAYSLITEDNAGQYYPDYAYNHPLFSKDMTIYSDSKISDFLNDMDDDQRIGFLNAWNTIHRSEKIYISYDSTNKNCQAMDIELCEYGHSKDDANKPIINTAVSYDVDNKIPLFYEEYPGSIVDISELDTMIEKAVGYGYKDIGFILDRGYFSKANIRHLDELNYDFLIAAKGTAKFIRKFIDEAKGGFESEHKTRNRRYQVYGKTVKMPVFSDDKDRYVHVFYNDLKAAIDRENFENDLSRMEMVMDKGLGTKKDYSSFKKFYNVHYDTDGIFTDYTPRYKIIEKEKSYCGYFVLISSNIENANKALMLYKSRDVSEKLFRADKSYLGNRAYRVQSVSSVKSKTFIAFIALIIRNRIFTYLSEEGMKYSSKPNYMDVPAALKELEKIEMIKGSDDIYRLDHAVSATQKKILKAFNMNASSVVDKANKIKKRL
ncbi:MAG: transposase [Solobacterium sp.]|nr:transposase [Solobacterium sp.]